MGPLMPKKIITARHYKGIGEVMVTWARLEAYMIEALASLMQTNLPNALVVFWHMSFKERKARLSSLVYLDHHDENSKIRKDFDTLYRRLEAAESVRNAVAHGLWFKGKTPQSIAPLIIRAKGGPVKITGPSLPADNYTAERLHQEAQKIDRLTEDFKQFFSAHFGTVFKITAKRL